MRAYVRPMGLKMTTNMTVNKTKRTDGMGMAHSILLAGDKKRKRQGYLSEPVQSHPDQVNGHGVTANIGIGKEGQNGTQDVTLNGRSDTPSKEQQGEQTQREMRIKKAWEFFEKMGSPKWHVAPMVDASELPFRMLCRKYGATCAYTPMLHGRLFVEGEKYRREHFTTCAEDRPLLTQFCANDPDILLQAARYVEKDCDAVDINLGCPQRIAKRGNYGAYLMDDLEKVESLVTILANNLSIPVTCKIRMFPEKEKTLEYAKMLQNAGCSLLAVHGRTREQRRCREIRADWNIIKEIKEALDIPVLANGNIRNLKDAKECMEYTGVDGVLSAEPLLENPTLFSEDRNETGEPQRPEECAEMLLEYLDFVEKYPTPIRMVRGHVHKMLKSWFNLYPHVRERMNSEVATIESFRKVATEMRDNIRGHEGPSPPSRIPEYVPHSNVEA